MQQAEIVRNGTEEVWAKVTDPGVLQSMLILVASAVAAYWLSRFVARLIIRIAQAIAVRADSTPDDEKHIQYRRVETYLSVTVALVRVLIVATVAYIAWRVLSPEGSASTVAIGASAFVIVTAGATLGPILRDTTAGAAMIIERWFHVGDFVRIEPFMEMGGVVERMTLRSTKLRSLNGEVIWLHNQHIQSVRVTPRGVRTIAVDVFVNNKDRGEKLVDKIIQTIPTGTMTVTKKLRITRREQWGDKLWLLTVEGQTPPGREWLIEDFFVASLKELDEKSRGARILVRKPLVRFNDPAAERSFRRAVRVSKER